MSRKLWIGAALALAVIIIVAAGLFFWQGQNEKHRLQASEIFSQYLEAPTTEKEKYLQEIGRRFADTPYYPRTLFLAAQQETEQDKAENLLTEARMASQDPYLYDIITLNLAARMGPQKSKEALSLLESGKTAAFKAFFLELKGDILTRGKDFAGARKAYEAALAERKFSKNYTPIVERKLARVSL
jgi:predicted negative regulator of RcsB-dependent stress response